MNDFTIDDLMTQMPHYVDADATQGVDKTIQFEFTGDESGSYYLKVQDGTAETHAGTADNPDVTIHTPSDLWKRIATGQENGAVAFMMRKFTAEGELPVLMAMQNWFNIPS